MLPLKSHIFYVIYKVLSLSGIKKSNLKDINEEIFDFLWDEYRIDGKKTH